MTPEIPTPPIVHAYRGIPEVRKWSRHQQIDHHWTVCGYHRSGKAGHAGVGDEGHNHVVTEKLSEVDCPFCLDLIDGTQWRQSLVQARTCRIPVKIASPASTGANDGPS